jgi:hypothetical protein
MESEERSGLVGDRRRLPSVTSRANRTPGPGTDPSRELRTSAHDAVGKLLGAGGTIS